MNELVVRGMVIVFTEQFLFGMKIRKRIIVKLGGLQTN